MTFFDVKTSDKEKGFVKFDPRTLLLFILLANVVIFFGTSIHIEYALMIMVFVLGTICGAFSLSTKMSLLYGALITIDILISIYLSNTPVIYVAVGLRFIRRVIPIGTIGGILIHTTRVSEIMAGLSKMKMRKSIIIPITVLLRYFPSIIEDRKAVKKAMAMRNLQTHFLKDPVTSIECFYVPMMMSASRRADELSCAAVTRGIENPKNRTTYVEVKFSAADYIGIIIALLFSIIGIYGGHI